MMLLRAFSKSLLNTDRPGMLSTGSRERVAVFDHTLSGEILPHVHFKPSLAQLWTIPTRQHWIPWRRHQHFPLLLSLCQPAPQTPSCRAVLLPLLPQFTFVHGISPSQVQNPAFWLVYGIEAVVFQENFTCKSLLQSRPWSRGLPFVVWSVYAKSN